MEFTGLCPGHKYIWIIEEFAYICRISSMNGGENIMKVQIHYPVDENGDFINEKQLELNQEELIVLSMSNKMGSEGHYYVIKDKKFEDTKDGISMTIILDNE